LTADLLTEARRFSQAGRLEESAKKYRQILALEPENPQAHFELGITVFRQGQHESAITHLGKAIELNSGQPAFHNALGIAYSGAGNLPAGTACFERALELEPGFAAALNNLGNNLKDQGKLADAAGCYRKVISAHPNYTNAYINLGDLLRRQGELAAALATYRSVPAADAGNPEIRFKLAVTLSQLSEYAEAIALLEGIVESHPDYPNVHNSLGLALIRLGRFEEGIASYEKAIESDPESAAPYNNLGNALKEQNDLEGAIAAYRNALAVKPDHARAHSNLLLALNYLADTSQQDLYEAALEFETQQTGNAAKSRPSFRNSRDEHRRLRIGYVSPDFRAHSVAHFIRKLIGTHDRDQVEVFCFANVTVHDNITDEFKAQTDHWVSILGMEDREAAERIRAECIDILIDLAGHTADNRLLMFSLRPAPIQATWLGYPNTTGMSCMDYRLTDAVADPPGAVDRWYTEKLIRLPHAFLCYQSDEANPAVTACPHPEQGHITYGSFNALPKITPDVIRTWAAIMTATPDSRLILKATAFKHESTRERIIEAFGKHGIAAERLDLPGLVPNRDEHLAMYSKIDIGLDPFPYNGTTTTFEALWMGVPVISLVGDRHASRVGASILHHVGIPELATDTVDEYIGLARSLATDKQRLVRMREALRPKMLESGIMDPQRFARSLEDAYRAMWKTWCDDHRR